MNATARIYTPAEAAAVSEVGVKAVHNAIDKNVIDAKSRPRASGRARRVLTDHDLLRLKLWYGVGSSLDSDRRKRLFEAIKAEPSARKVKADDFLIVDVAEARRQLAARVRTLDQAGAAIHRVKGVMGGEPVFRGTRVPVRMIAAMLTQGAPESEILEGYPALTPRMLELAKIWVAAHPARGRPKSLSDQGLKKKSSKRASLKGDPRTRNAGASV